MSRSVPNNFLGGVELNFLPTKMGGGDKIVWRYKMTFKDKVNVTVTLSYKYIYRVKEERGFRERSL